MLNFFIPDGNWSGWYDRDHPSGNGDYELIDLMNKVGIYLILNIFFFNLIH